MIKVTIDLLLLLFFFVEVAPSTRTGVEMLHSGLTKLQKDFQSYDVMDYPEGRKASAHIMSIEFSSQLTNHQHAFRPIFLELYNAFR